MSDNERQLLHLLTQRSFKSGHFVLASGATSTYYIDGRTSAVFSRSARLIGEVIYERTRDLSFEAIGGLAVGAVPLTTAAVIAYDAHGRELDGFWVRDKAKDHGMRKQVEGRLPAGARVVIVDDVITSGGSSLQAIEAVRGMGCEVVRVLALVDRLQGAAAAFRAHGVGDFQAVFTIRDFGVEVPGDAG